MALQQVAGRRTGEDVADLQRWLRGLSGCPEVTDTVVAACRSDAHAAEPGTWFYVEADPSGAVARRRCLSCGESHDVLDSAEHWTHPRMWSCRACGQSIAEVAAGMHVEDAEAGRRVTWLALGARCVECGTLDGLTDFAVELPVDEVTAAI